LASRKSFKNKPFILTSSTIQLNFDKLTKNIVRQSRTARSSIKWWCILLLLSFIILSLCSIYKLLNLSCDFFAIWSCKLFSHCYDILYHEMWNTIKLI
jgi:hypothetical protein